MQWSCKRDRKVHNALLKSIENQTRSDLTKQEHVESLKKCVGKLHRQTEKQILTLFSQNGLFNFDEIEFENCLWKEEILRDIQIRNMHEMGWMKRLQELRVDEVSVHKSTNQETIQKLTSQSQQIQYQINFQIDSADFQNVKSHCCVRLSHVSSHFVMISSFRSMHVQQRSKIAAWHMESIWITGKRFWKSIFYFWSIQKSSSKNSSWRRAKKSRSSPRSKKDEDCFKQVEDRLRVHQHPWHSQRTTWSDSYDSYYWNWNSTKIDFQQKSVLVLIFTGCWANWEYVSLINSKQY